MGCNRTFPSICDAYKHGVEDLNPRVKRPRGRDVCSKLAGEKVTITLKQKQFFICRTILAVSFHSY